MQNEPEIPSPKKTFRLGVLFVHGMGTQSSGETLTKWGDVLLSTIRRATRNTVEITVDRGSLEDAKYGGIPQVEVTLSRGTESERWLLGEGWWAESFHAPTYREFVSWIVRAMPWSLAIHVAQGYWQSPSHHSKDKGLALGKALALLLGAFALAPVLLFILVLTLLLGLLPIPRLRALILSAQSVLTGVVGDSLAFVESPVRAALIRTRIADGLDDLKKVCDRTIIVAHSQGAAAVLDALGGIVEPSTAGVVTASEETPPHILPNTLVTFGAGTNQLVSLKALAGGLTKRLGYNPTYSGIGSVFAVAAVAGWFYLGVESHKFSATQLLWTAALWFGATAATMLLFAVIRRLLRAYPVGWAKLQKQHKYIATGVPVTFVLASVFGVIAYAEHANLPLGPVNFLGFALMMLAGAVVMILSRDMQTAVTALVSKPSGLERWIDIYASADPVPHGPTRITDPTTIESVPVWNRGSLFEDHTTYWDNLDGFVMRVVRACAHTASSPWEDALPNQTPIIDERGAWRVSVLRLMRWITGPVWLLLLALFWIRDRDLVSLPFTLPAWLPALVTSYARFGILIAIVAVSAWLTSCVLQSPWRWWVRAEQEKILDHKTPAGMPWAAVVGTGFAVWTFLSVAVVVLRSDDLLTPLRVLRDDPSGVFSSLSFPFGCSIISAVMLRWLLPPPRDSSAAKAPFVSVQSA